MDDPALDALDRLCVAVADAQEQCVRILERAEELRALRADGLSWVEVVRTEDRPLAVERLSAVITSLSESGAAWRRQEARALHEEGLSMERIAGLFGVTRQRVSALLAEQREPGVRVR